MNTYQSITISFTDPGTEEVFTVRGFGRAGITKEKFIELFRSEIAFKDLKPEFKIGEPVELVEIAGYPGFLPFIEALESEE